MSTDHTFKLMKLSRIDSNTKNTVFGYMRKAQLLFPKNNIYYNIPMLIQYICLSYYYIGMVLDIKNHGNGLIFSNNDKNVKQTINAWSTCVLINDININDCNKFNIHIKYVKTGAFQMGYIINTINSIKNWNRETGCGSNTENSVGIYVYHYRDTFTLYDKNDCAGLQTLNYKSPKFFAINDIFILSFDFIENTLTIYHNDNKCDTIELQKHTKIIPAFSLYYPGTQIEILKCDFL